MPAIEEQKKFIKKIKRTINKAKKNGETVLFLDPTHQIYNAESGYAWQEKGKENTKIISSNTGRKRINIIGALNPVNFNTIPIITESNCDKEVIKQLLNEIRKEHPGNKTIYVFLDNARYNYNKEVSRKAKEINIKLKFLPPYCPNLNLIERLWKFLKKTVRKNHYYKTFGEFKKAIFDFLKNIDRYKNELKSLLTLNFEIIGINKAI